MSPSERGKYWFPAKRYGWGWGIPATWQGWAVLLTYLVVLLAGVFPIRSVLGAFAAVAYAMVLSLVLLAICWRTGEPPRWRWGGRDS